MILNLFFFSADVTSDLKPVMPPLKELFQILWKEKEEAKKTYEKTVELLQKQNEKLLKENQVWNEYCNPLAFK